MCSNTSSSGAGVSGSVGDDGNVSFVPDHNYFSPPSPPMSMLYGNGGKNAVLGGGSKGLNLGRSAMAALPEQTLLSTMWSSGDSSFCEEAPKISSGYPFLTNFPNRSDQMHHHSSSMLQNKHSQYPSPTKNLFPNSGSLSSPDSQSAGLFLRLEPPSNQRLHHNYISLLPEEDKACKIPMMTSTKRLRTFSVEDPSGPFHYPVSSPFSHMHTLDQSPSYANHSAFGLKRNDSVSRDHPKPGGPLELNTKKSITDYGTLNGNFLLFGCPATTPPLTQTPQQEFSRSQESMEGSHRMSGQSGSAQKKPYYSFLIPEDKMGETETTLSLNHERSGARGKAIDLNLRLYIGGSPNA
ncbi:hypothetical protein Pint_10464 [Pistacia integerrima]|uniref:Uncharacterized protein n=1 Tax=Pistacia integerrima TaxID=434235 RepID=A0ACC0XGA1_9ROSI|nr:hypothetical protein Pint_10464 [Pistacia integerrima]